MPDPISLWRSALVPLFRHHSYTHLGRHFVSRLWAKLPTTAPAPWFFRLSFAVALFSLSSLPSSASAPAVTQEPVAGMVPTGSGPSPIAAPEEGINRRALRAARLPSPPRIDGDLSDPVWQQAVRAERFTDAIRNHLVEDQTVAWVGYDDRNIYVAFSAYDRQPEGIVGRETKRDTPFRGEDTVTFSLEPYNTHSDRDRSSFTVNPLGTQYARLAGGRANKLEWQGAWQAAAKIAADGWTAEMAIPWEILNYPILSGPQIAGINFERRQERTKIRSWWSNLGPNELLDLNGQWTGILFPRFRPRYSILPYVTTGGDEDQGLRLRSGLDFRSALTPSLTGVATLNPDFENVEGAVEGIDFSYGERFVPDVRPFFLEGSGVYETDSELGEYFFSGRIPGFDTGLNLYGKATPRDTIGVLAAADVGERVDWVLREWHSFGPTSSGNLAFINRDERGFSNRVLVLGEEYRRGFWNLDMSGAQSWTNGRSTGATGEAVLQYESPRWSFSVVPHFVEPDFRADLGFIRFTGFRGVNTEVSYTNEWRDGPIRRLWVDSDTLNANRYDGTVFRRQRDLQLEVETRNDMLIGLGWEGGRFEEFKDSVFTVELRDRVSDPFHTYGMGVSWGRRAGHQITFLTPFVTWRFGSRLTLGLSSAILQHIEDRQQHVLTVNYDFSPRKGIAGRIVAQDEGTTGYVAYRDSGYGGVERWFILGDPNSDDFRMRALMKVVWPF